MLILTGGLGVGKTHFTKGVSRGLGDGHMVTSLRSRSWLFTIKVVFRCFTLIYTAWSMPTSSRIRAFSMCWAMRVLACWNGANNSRTRLTDEYLSVTLRRDEGDSDVRTITLEAHGDRAMELSHLIDKAVQDELA